MPERGPGGGADDAVGGQAVAALEGLDGALGAGAEDAVGGDAERALEVDDRALLAPARARDVAGVRGAQVSYVTLGMEVIELKKLSDPGRSKA